jgi:uncharacterized membrane protein
MPETVLGLPLHPLVVHATVVLVPLTAMLLVLTSVSPRLRAWAGPLPLVAAAISVVLAPLSTSTGENLEEVFPENDLIEKHADLGEMLIWWVVAMLVVAAAQHLLARRGSVGKGLATALMVLGVVVGIGTTVQVALIGHSGAKAVWDGVGQPVDD